MLGNTSRLEAWFEQAGPAAAGNAPFGAPGSQMPGSLAVGPQPTGMATNGASTRAGAEPGRPQGIPGSQYQVDGERIRVQFLMRAEATEVENLAVDNQVHLVEVHTATPGDVPLVVVGDRLEVLRANALDTDVTVHGHPGQVGARGLEMYGETIRLNKGSNRLWIDGPGRMKLPANRGAGGNDLLGFGQPAAPPPRQSPQAAPPPADPMFVNWQGRMDFDGQTAHFEQNIVGQSATRNLKTDNLDVILRQRVNFAAMRPQDQTEVGRILCHGVTLMESRTIENDKLASVDKMQVKDLIVDEVTGLVEGQGPGWITSVRHGDNNLMAPNLPAGAPKPRAAAAGQSQPGAAQGPNGAILPGANPAALAQNKSHVHGSHHSHSHTNSIAKGDHLNYLNVQFAGPLTGNLNQHEFTMHQRVHTIYGPVLSWNDQLYADIMELDDGDALMTCDEMTIRQGAGYVTSPAPQRPGQLPGAQPGLQPGAQPGNGLPQPGQPIANSQPPAPHHPMEMEAVGNTTVEAKNFTVKANRVTYAEAKDLMVLEGDGRRDAELYRQDVPGAAWTTTSAKKILYWRSTNRVSVNDAHFFDLAQPNDPNDTKDPTKKSKLGQKMGPGVASPANGMLQPR